MGNEESVIVKISVPLFKLIILNNIMHLANSPKHSKFEKSDRNLYSTTFQIIIFKRYPKHVGANLCYRPIQNM